jgi:hypothetical protein
MNQSHETIWYDIFRTFNKILYLSADLWNWNKSRYHKTKQILEAADIIGSRSFMSKNTTNHAWNQDVGHGCFTPKRGAWLNITKRWMQGAYITNGTPSDWPNTKDNFPWSDKSWKPARKMVVFGLWRRRIHFVRERRKICCFNLHMYGAEPFLRSCQSCSHSGNSKRF